jgi:serine/threonine protein kinase
MPLAAGGMARIYIGRATGIGSFERHVVLKLITPERANDTIAVQMFLDEARLAASLNHQNVAQVFEVGEDSGIHYLAMEYVHGQDLRALLAKAGSQGTRIPLELALTTVAGAAAGLNHAHDRRGPDGLPLGIVHRDVSPSNIMVGYDGAVKLLDFGIAKATSRSVETQSGIIKGKFAYMAPEQCRGRDVDRRSDVFSLGIILYEISTQHRCFRADSDFDTMHRIVTGDVVRPTRLVPSYPPALEAIVMKALAIDAAQRYQSAGALLEAIEAFAVVSRLSLSTMGLGRFMRDMFGDVSEPWVGARASQPVIAEKESTISSTDGRSQVGPSPVLQTEPSPVVIPAPERLQSEPGVPQLHDHDPDSGAIAATLVMEPGRGRPGANPADWQSFGVDPPSHAPIRAGGLPLGHEPVAPTVVIQPSPTSPAAIAAQAIEPPIAGHGATGPALPGLPSTRHGYGSGVGITLAGTGPSAPSSSTGASIEYPRYEPPVEPSGADLQLRPNRTVLYAGASLLAVGVFVVIALAVAGNGKPDDISRHVSESPATTPIDAAIDEYIAIKINSQPPGAEVLIAGTKVGPTPFVGKLRRGTKIAPLVVHKDGYVDFTSKIDLADGYTNEAIELVKAPEPIKPVAPPPPVGSAGTAAITPAPAPTATTNPSTTNPTTTTEHHPKTTTTTVHVDHPTTTPTKTPSTTHVTPSATSKPKCQPAGAMNPFDTSCDGKACPACP